MRCTVFSSDKGDVRTILAFVNNQSATTDPGVGDDISAGYEPGSQWINTAADRVWTCTNNTAGAAVWVVSSSDETTPGQIEAPDAATPTGAGSVASLKGGAGGATSGAGGQARLLGGSAAGTNSNGGSVLLDPGAKTGTGKDGVILHRGVDVLAQGAPAAKTVSATLTAAELLTGIITVNQAGAAASAQQLPLAADLDTALPDAAAGDSFDFSVINTSTVDAEDASLTTNTGWTLVGSMDVPAYSAAGSLNSSGRFRARKTGTAAWTLYRLA